jgi:hypothetical protein
MRTHKGRNTREMRERYREIRIEQGKVNCFNVKEGEERIGREISMKLSSEEGRESGKEKIDGRR